jgi:hypothetical protein
VKSFFKGFNLARGIIVFSLVASLVLGWLCWQRQQELVELRQDVSTQKMTPMVTALRQAALRHKQLSQSVKGEGLVGQQALVSYIRTVGAKDRIEIGELNLTLTEASPSTNIVDKKVTMKPDNPQASFKRMTLVNFFHTLETDSRRVKLTRVKIEVADMKGLKPHEIPQDNWRFDAEVTSRQRKEP